MNDTVGLQHHGLFSPPRQTFTLPQIVVVLTYYIGYMSPPYTQVVDTSTGRFSVGVVFVQHMGTSGYLFAKSLSDDSKRFFSVYSRQGRLVVYYQPLGGAPKRSVEFDTNVATGELTRLLLSFSSTRVTARIDGVYAGVQSLQGEEFPIEDCDSSTPGCVLYVGGRAAPVGRTVFVLTGAVWDVLLYQRTELGFDPTFSPPTFDFSRVAFINDTRGMRYVVIHGEMCVRGNCGLRGKGEKRCFVTRESW